mmetsp:Transcript_38517/g.92217  ORF Transcript_38517/g.92217 Transcript_38517/m.92217 type:complete len:336 (+) Transcript_38517:127-1134(+)
MTGAQSAKRRGGTVCAAEVRMPAAGHVLTSAVPTAVDVERGKLVLGSFHNREEDNGDDDDEVEAANQQLDETFEELELPKETTSDHDIDRLLGPLPQRRKPLEVEHMGGRRDSGRQQRRKSNEKFCGCCPAFVRRGPCQSLAILTSSEAPNDRVGNMLVISRGCYDKHSCGIMGPHWFGPVSCFALLSFATLYFGHKAYANIGTGSLIICLAFYTHAVISLLMVSCSDPGVVRPDGRGKDGYAGVPSGSVSAGRGWRYCDICSVYQPPGAVHCPECNVCVRGYDHHCPWMGTCIGEGNWTSFCAFNATWLIYLFYAIIWVSFIGAIPFEDEDSSD